MASRLTLEERRLQRVTAARRHGTTRTPDRLPRGIYLVFTPLRKAVILAGIVLGVITSLVFGLAYVAGVDVREISFFAASQP